MGRRPKSGYINSEETEGIDEQCLSYVNYKPTIAEQETTINLMRDEDFATIYTCDTTMITKFDKLCKTSPDYYSLIEDTGYGKRYKVADKSLISFRQKKKEMSEENKAKASERFKELHAEGKIGRKKKTDN